VIVQRITWVVKKNCLEKLLEMIKESAANSPIQKIRVYIPNIGPNDVFTAEFEFENLADLEMTYSEWFSIPETTEFLRKWDELTETGGSSEVWNLVFSKQA
jgi:hypothetical protein